jgi:hypothetical protein
VESGKDEHEAPTRHVFECSSRPMAIVLVACGSSKSTNTPPGAPATTAAPATTSPTSTCAQPAATTPCTIP